MPKKDGRWSGQGNHVLKIREISDLQGNHVLKIREISDLQGNHVLKIREIGDLQENDIADIAELERHIFSDAWTENGIRETLYRDHTVVLGVWKDGLMVGYVILYYVLDEGEIARIAVESSCRRQGVAGYLLGELSEICEIKGIARLMLEVRKSNTAAISFYKKHGFTEDGTRKGYYTGPCEDAVLMSKIL